jgi:TRAP-type mannitol/chloroaromatic compound transport system permease large subunit
VPAPYLNGVSSAHVRLDRIFAGRLAFMAIHGVALMLLHAFSDLGLRLPHTPYQ